MEDKKIVGVTFESKQEPSGKRFYGKEYCYYIDPSLDITLHDIVEVPTKYGVSVAIISRTGIQEEEIKEIKEFMKTITTKLNKEEYLNGSKD